MNTRPPYQPGWAAGALSFLLAACGTSQPPIVAQSAGFGAASSPVRSGHGAPLLYVLQYARSVQVYDANAKDPSPKASITYGLNTASGDCVDGEGTLYVTNQPGSGSGWISEYPAGKVKPSKIVRNGVSTPAFCAIDNKEDLWVANIGGSVVEYVEGATKPSFVITKGLLYPVGIAVDASGNIYVSNGLGGSAQNVVVYASGSKSPSRTITDGVISPVGIAVDAQGTLYVTNIRQNDVDKYRAGQSQPYETITEGMNQPSSVTVDKRGYLYVTNYAGNTVVEFRPGALKPSKRAITKDLTYPQDSAYFPPLVP